MNNRRLSRLSPNESYHLGPRWKRSPPALSPYCVVPSWIQMETRPPPASLPQCVVPSWTQVETPRFLLYSPNVSYHLGPRWKRSLHSTPQLFRTSLDPAGNAPQDTSGFGKTNGISYLGKNFSNLNATGVHMCSNHRGRCSPGGNDTTRHHQWTLSWWKPVTFGTTS